MRGINGAGGGFLKAKAMELGRQAEVLVILVKAVKAVEFDTKE